MHYDDAHTFALKVKHQLKFLTKCSTIIVGSIRRKSSIVHDIDLLVISADPNTALKNATLRRGPLFFVKDLSNGIKRRSMLVRDSQTGRVVQVDLFVATTSEKPYALFHHTGSVEYNIRVRANAARQGWRLNQYGIFNASTGRRVQHSAAIHSEKELARFLGITYRAPPDRIA